VSARDPRSLALAIAALAAATPACLPRGEPPAGRQVIAGREAQLAAIVPPNDDGVLRILVFRPGAGADTKDLYAVSVDATGGPPSERLLRTGLDPADDLGCLHRLAPCGQIDARGGIWFYTGDGPIRIDAITGERLDLPSSSPSWPLISPSGQRVFVSEYSFGDTSSAPGTLYEADGRQATFDVAPYAGVGSTFAFFGEDFYYLAAGAELMHVPPSGAPEQLAVGVAGFEGFPTPDGALLILIRATAEPKVHQWYARDPATGQETAFPFGADSPTFQGSPISGDIHLSPDGPWLLITDAVAKHFMVLDYRSGAQQVIAFPDDFAGYGGHSWRPGTFQIWLTTGASETPTVRILSPDAPPISIPGLAFAGFTGDGAFWFSTASGPDVTWPVIQVGPADDPTAPRRLLTPPGTYDYNDWALADGRWMMAVFAKDMDRSDIIAVDLATGDSRLLAERGRMAAVGETRFLGMFHFEGGAGDLTTVEIATGRQTILAPEFAVTAFVEPQGADLVAPGRRVVYEFAARSPSPYDGIWVANVP
jgi:hypothetical protein